VNWDTSLSASENINMACYGCKDISLDHEFDFPKTVFVDTTDCEDDSYAEADAEHDEWLHDKRLQDRDKRDRYS